MEGYGVPDVPPIRDMGRPTLRQWYAGLAMQAMISNAKIMRAILDITTKTKQKSGDYIAVIAFKHADAMIAQEKK